MFMIPFAEEQLSKGRMVFGEDLVQQQAVTSFRLWT
jgi:hypothetical protein